jgi:hypothetical protein
MDEADSLLLAIVFIVGIPIIFVMIGAMIIFIRDEF